MKLQRKMPIMLAEMIRIADSYALGDPTQPRIASNESNEEYNQRDGARSSRRNDYRGKRRDDRPDHRYGSQQVAAVQWAMGPDPCAHRI